METVPITEAKARIAELADRVAREHDHFTITRNVTRRVGLGRPRTCCPGPQRPGPPGAIVVFSPYILHRRPDLYPQPHRFDPARWLAPSPELRASYLPFGAGATRYIGEEFGLAEATLILASMAARWNLAPEAGTTVSPAARAVLVPRAFPVRLTARPGSGRDTLPVQDT